ncbi:MAG: hypothetical protein E7355_02460 [Clostridiales bacterium]|nr:hypothetical protein [Clostridiales bacterium]
MEMDGIIAGIYYGNLQEADRIEYPKNEKTEKQTRLHKELQEKMPAEIKDLFNDFFDTVTFNIVTNCLPCIKVR